MLVQGMDNEVEAYQQQTWWCYSDVVVKVVAATIVGIK